MPLPLFFIGAAVATGAIGGAKNIKAVADNAKITLHIDKIRGDNSHHILESTFKAFARAMKKAVSITGNVTDVTSTKGVL